MLPKAVDKVILVGGATRTPLVSPMLQGEMGIDPHHEINPDLIVSMGAAIQGAAISGKATKSILVDITPYTFGTRAIGDIDGRLVDNKFVPVIRRNTSLPVAKEELFFTSFDNQSQILVEIYQGEAPVAHDNIFIGEFMVKNLSKVAAGNPILLNLELDVNGILKVTAKEKATGLTKTVSMDTSRGDNASDLASKKLNIASLLGEDEDVDDDLDDEADQLLPETEDKQTLIAKAKTLRNRTDRLLPHVNAEDGAELSNLLEQSRLAIADQQWEAVAKLNESPSDMLFYLED